MRRIDVAEPTRLVVTRATLDRIWARADKQQVWELPSSIYDNDLSDDIYHFGVSVELRHGGQLFNHRVPTGVVVRCVPATTTTTTTRARARRRRVGDGE